MLETRSATLNLVARFFGTSTPSTAMLSQRVTLAGRRLCCWIIVLLLISFQATQGSSLFREDMEGEEGAEIQPPPPSRPPNPLGDVLTVFLQPLQYLASALENILRLFAQLGQKIVVSINDKLTAILH